MTVPARLCRLAGAIVVLALVFAHGAQASTAAKRPVLFVHGLRGSGAQFESQALRLTSNGYPASWIDEVDYDSSAAASDPTAVNAQIDQRIAALKRRTHSAKVDVVAHSLGTFVMHDYLTDPTTGAARRASVAHYVNVDGQDVNPGLPTLAIWAGISPGASDRHMDGAKNVTIAGQTHVQVLTSVESFNRFFRFLTGRKPAHDIVREGGKVKVAGRAEAFPQNTGLAGATVQVWPLDASGHRTGSSPLASSAVTDGSQGGGAFGPIPVRTGKRYEFAVVRPGMLTSHTYFEPFVRSDPTLRLFAVDGLEPVIAHHPGSVAAVIVRDKDLWGDQPAQNDSVTVNGISICTASICPQADAVAALFAYDRNGDGQTDLSAPDPVLGRGAADVFIPSSPDASGTTTFELLSRDEGPLRTVRTPNWDSDGHLVAVRWNDFEASEVEPRNGSD